MQCGSHPASHGAVPEVPRGIMLPRRGLHRLRYHGGGLRGPRYHVLHVRRAPLLTMRATAELSDRHATFE